MQNHRNLSLTAPVALLSAVLLFGLLGQVRAQPLPWHSLELEGRKFIFTLHMDLEITKPSQTDVSQALQTPFRGQPLMPQGDVVHILLRSRALGRHSQRETLLDAKGRALQVIRTRQKPRLAYKVERYTKTGLARLIKVPTPKEKRFPIARWTGSEKEFVDFSADQIPPQISAPDALLYVLATSPLHTKGDHAVFHVFSGGHIAQITLEVTDKVQQKVRFDLERAPQTSERISGQRSALQIQVQAKSISADAQTKTFDLMGLRKNIVVLLDTETRAPLVISGNTKRAGTVKLQLKRLRLNAPVAQ